MKLKKNITELLQNCKQHINTVTTVSDATYTYSIMPTSFPLV